MKFGKIFRQTVETRMPQWRDHVINYKQLKQAIKHEQAAGTMGAHARPLPNARP